MSAEATFDSRTVVVLAGERRNDPLCRARGVSRKALIPVAGQPMLTRVLDVLMKSRHVRDIVVVANDAGALAQESGIAGYAAVKPITFREGADSPIASLARLNAEGWMTGPTIIVASDLALLTTRAFDDFCDRAKLLVVDAAIGVLDRAVFDRRYPGVHRTFVRLRDGAYKGANLFAFNTPRAWYLAHRLARQEHDRKNPLSLLWMLGPLNVIQALLGWIGLDDAFARLSRRLRLRIAPVRLDDPDLGIDVDLPEHLIAAEQNLGLAPVSA